MDKQTRGIDPMSILEGGKDTFKERSAPYGEAYKRFGHIMMSLFPGGLALTNADDWNRYACFHMIVAKMARYANCFHEGHIDSSHDSMVYSAMLESLDHEQDPRQPEPTVAVVVKETCASLPIQVTAERDELFELREKMKRIKNMIWDSGAPLGSANYFKIRAIAAGMTPVATDHNQREVLDGNEM